MKKVSVICVNCAPDYIDNVLIRQTYENLEVVEAVTGKEFYQDIVDYCETTDSDYICFLEAGQLLAANKIQRMVEYAEQIEQAAIEVGGAAVIFCNRVYLEGDGTIVSHQDAGYYGAFKDTIFEGNQVLRVCLERGHNLLGNLTSVMFDREKVKLCMESLQQYQTEQNPAMQKAFLLFEILQGKVMALLEEPLVGTFVERFDETKLKQQAALFQEQLELFVRIHGWQQFQDIPNGLSAEHRYLLQDLPVEDRKLKKEITFFATEKGEYYNMLPIAEYAKTRGYKVRHTDNLDEKAEIGVYCQHVGKPQNSKFSLVLLHDMAQGHLRWPNIWEMERWNVYDIGIVPGEDWKDRWERCALQYFVNPRCGAYMLGYPKSTEIFSAELHKRVEELRESMNFQHKITVLYAPSWECDEKEDDFVRALSSLPVNLIVKQSAWPPKGYSDIVKNIADMRKLHEGHYENLHYIESEESIMVALMMCDIVVSDESSVMVEGLLFGKPSIAVKDWLIPDVKPSRFADIPFGNVYKCKKVELREMVEKLLAIGPENADIVKDAEGIFVNKKNVNRDILDAIEYFTTGSGSAEFMKWKMSSCYMPANMWS